MPQSLTALRQRGAPRPAMRNGRNSPALRRKSAGRPNCAARMRGWLAATWTTAADWVNTRDMSAADFLRRISTQYSASRRDAKARAHEHAAVERAKVAAANALRDRVQSAGITVEGLIGLVDVSPRTTEAALRGKLAELEVGDRNLRIFETSDPNVLAVIEKSEAGRSQYAIERDNGLVADLRLFAEASRAFP